MELLEVMPWELVLALVAGFGGYNRMLQKVDGLGERVNDAHTELSELRGSSVALAALNSTVKAMSEDLGGRLGRIERLLDNRSALGGP